MPSLSFSFRMGLLFSQDRSPTAELSFPNSSRGLYLRLQFLLYFSFTKADLAHYPPRGFRCTVLFRLSDERDAFVPLGYWSSRPLVSLLPSRWSADELHFCGAARSLP